jgi:formylglycine-generating enzyme required for sulfatase activity
MDTTSLMGLSRAEVEKVQRSWADYLGVPVEIADVIGSGVTMEFVLVPPGKFVMGSPPGEAGRAPNEGQRTVEIVEPFYLGKDEVTQQQWQTVMNDNPSYFRPGGEGAFAITGQATSRFPVENVSWTDAEQFTKTLTRRGTGGVVYRLPTEAEWEYACRGGRGPSQPFGVGNGSSLSSTQANFNGTEPYGGAAMGPNLGRPSKVGSYAANALGLRDMHGNVWEWCADKYPANTGEELRVNRGGGWFSNAALCRAAHRDGDRVEHQLRILGVRLARSVASR